MVTARLSAFCLVVAGLASSPYLARADGVAEAPAVALPLDQERNVDGVGVACTGIGQTKADPRWLAYSVRLEFSNPAREYLANEAVAVSDPSGRRMVAVSCEGPWILVKLPAGAYRATAWLPRSPESPVSASFRAPAKGQLRVVLQFPSN